MKQGVSDWEIGALLDSIWFRGVSSFKGHQCAGIVRCSIPFISCTIHRFYLILTKKCRVFQARHLIVWFKVRLYK